jgi:tight adherence protein C
MPVDLAITLAAVFVSVALASATAASIVLSRTAPEVRRLRPAARAAGVGVVAVDVLPGQTAAVDEPSGKPLRRDRMRDTRLRRQLEIAGWDADNSTTVYTALQLLLTVLCAALPVALLGLSTGWPISVPAAAVGYMIPDFLLSRSVNRYKRAIQNGLPDALDLLVVCVEAGTSLDQAILKASEELDLAIPPVASELRLVATEIRAGKPRLEAFQNFAKRTRLDDVRALVTMLIQADRFGTSIAQSLRTHADALRTKRRQYAEERAGKVGVKLVFPLVLCLLPALYVVCLGPVAVRMYRTLF